FEDFMRAALYEPKLGYYESEHVFGEAGDFVTGADLGPWLAMGFADLMLWGWQQLGSPDHWVLLEQGGGTGRLLTQVLRFLQHQDIAFPTVIAVERSAWMRGRQKTHYSEKGFDIEQYAELADVKTDLPVLMMCNELPDAFPIRSFIWSDRCFYERGVQLSDNALLWAKSHKPMTDKPSIDAMLIEAWPNDYISEYNPALPAWQQDISRLIANGFVFCVDYGYSQQEYYRPNRIEGTLMGHKAHQVVEDILSEPGLCDLTAHVDFTDLAKLGVKCGLLPCSFMTQGGWLAQSPTVQQAISELAQEGSLESVQALTHAKRMLLPFGMGETFKLLVQGKGKQVCPDYLKGLDRMRDLRLDT
ncbi:MAG: SAM-dependent methyltransferase, partial [Mariprofundaceae bacterium]|nr:SAM-dependent methyltransferase [Mariprofundaceae bacterium]